MESLHHGIPEPNSPAFSRIREAARHLFRRQPPPAMIGTPPSQRPTWHDPAAHSPDFAERYATELDYAKARNARATPNMSSGSPTHLPWRTYGRTR